MNLSPKDVEVVSGRIDRYDEICQIGERPWIARMLYKGMRYGSERNVIHDEDEPVVEIYDGSHLGSVKEPGQFIARYYLETLKNDRNLCERGLNLDGGVKEWGMTGGEFKKMMEWANENVIKEAVFDMLLCGKDYKEPIAENNNIRVELVDGFRVLGIAGTHRDRYEIITYKNERGTISARGVPLVWRDGVEVESQYYIRLVEKDTNMVIAETQRLSRFGMAEQRHMALAMAVNKFKGMKVNELTLRGFGEVIASNEEKIISQTQRGNSNKTIYEDMCEKEMKKEKVVKPHDKEDLGR